MRNKPLALGHKPSQPVEASCAPNRHWLVHVPEMHSDLMAELQRLQRAISALIAAGAITKSKAEQAYEIAGR